MDGEDGVETLRSAHDEGAIEIVSLEETPLVAEFRRNLDRGEAATLAYAIEADADLVLLDEREARQTARRHGLSMTGVIGILMRGCGDDTETLRTNSTAFARRDFGSPTNCTRRLSIRHATRADAIARAP